MITSVSSSRLSEESPAPGLPEADLNRLEAIFSAYLEENAILPETASACEVSLAWASKDEIARINLEYRDTEGPTDVLSFPMWEDEDGRFSPPEDWEHIMLGDIIVCPEVVSANAEANGKSCVCETALIICHGFLHLIGFDHAEDNEREAMWKEQALLLQRFLGEGELSADGDR